MGLWDPMKMVKGFTPQPQRLRDIFRDMSKVLPWKRIFMQSVISWVGFACALWTGEFGLFCKIIYFCLGFVYLFFFFKWGKKNWKSLKKTPTSLSFGHFGKIKTVRCLSKDQNCSTLGWMKLLWICKAPLFATYYREMLAEKIFFQSHSLSVGLTGIQRDFLVSNQFIDTFPNLKSPKDLIFFFPLQSSFLLVTCLKTFLFRCNWPEINTKVPEVFKLEKSYYRIQPWTTWGYRKAQN